MGEGLRHRAFLVMRPMTLGVRALIQNDADEILLVEHSYKPGWHLPGGGVEASETALDALSREMHEEVGIVPTDTPRCLGIFANQAASPRDHVVLFHVRAFETVAPPHEDGEVAATLWAPRTRLPDGCDAGIARRLAELARGTRASPLW
jgi:ADP-ribose pyrophosphatase YjhB (NUDIX family)